MSLKRFSQSRKDSSLVMERLAEIGTPVIRSCNCGSHILAEGEYTCALFGSKHARQDLKSCPENTPVYNQRLGHILRLDDARVDRVLNYFIRAEYSQEQPLPFFKAGLGVLSIAYIALTQDICFGSVFAGLNLLMDIEWTTGGLGDFLRMAGLMQRLLGQGLD